jgi:hypothetical protein
MDLVVPWFQGFLCLNREKHKELRKEEQCEEFPNIPLEIWTVVWEYLGTMKEFTILRLLHRQNDHNDVWKHVLRDRTFKVQYPFRLIEQKASFKFVSRIDVNYRPHDVEVPWYYLWTPNLDVFDASDIKRFEHVNHIGFESGTFPLVFLNALQNVTSLRLGVFNIPRMYKKPTSIFNVSWLENVTKLSLRQINMPLSKLGYFPNIVKLKLAYHYNEIDNTLFEVLPKLRKLAVIRCEWKSGYQLPNAAQLRSLSITGNDWTIDPLLYNFTGLETLCLYSTCIIDGRIFSMMPDLRSFVYWFSCTGPLIDGYTRWNDISMLQHLKNLSNLEWCYGPRTVGHHVLDLFDRLEFLELPMCRYNEIISLGKKYEKLNQRCAVNTHIHADNCNCERGTCDLTMRLFCTKHVARDYKELLNEPHLLDLDEIKRKKDKEDRERRSRLFWERIEKDKKLKTFDDPHETDIWIDINS